jgi:hypothetical protein
MMMRVAFWITDFIEHFQKKTQPHHQIRLATRCVWIMSATKTGGKH